ncbi:MAG: hypothetical protein JRI97_12840 [Deltaproteobacteria bacterium]|nr:hypothetical protein [Deltaproteobacteria bacterium]
MIRIHHISNHKLISLLLSLTLVLAAGAAGAKMVPLSDEELGSIRARTGMTFTAQDMDIEGDTAVIAWGDRDGLDGLPAGWVSLNNLVSKGSVDFHDTLSARLTTSTIGGVTEVTGMELSFDTADIHIEHMEIGNITLGDSPGTGNSLGSLYIGDMNLRVRGNIRMLSE